MQEGGYYVKCVEISYTGKEKLSPPAPARLVPQKGSLKKGLLCLPVRLSCPTFRGLQGEGKFLCRFKRQSERVGAPSNIQTVRKQGCRKEGHAL